MRFALLVTSLIVVACFGPASVPDQDAGSDLDAATHLDAGTDATTPMDATSPPDTGSVDAPLARDAPGYDADATCASGTSMARVTRLPVDIIWVIDNSNSMGPAIVELQTGLNTFATRVASRALDYRVIVLSLRGSGPISTTSGTRYGVCIPPPLSSDDACGDGPDFFHINVDIKSTQSLEQLLGTLAQTTGYTETDSRGGPPWRDRLRDGATRTIVVVSDDDARFTADQFEHFAGGMDPYNTTVLPPGILDASWGGLFDGYVFDAIYGWGSDTDPAAVCMYADGTSASSSGPDYTELVAHTGGQRAKICDVATAWDPFLDAVATSVELSSRVDCTIPIPDPPDGFIFDPTRINVVTLGTSDSTTIGHVDLASDCDARGGWYYNGGMSQVILCPTSCDSVQPTDHTPARRIQVQFGCLTVGWL